MQRGLTYEENPPTPHTETQNTKITASQSAFTFWVQIEVLSSNHGVQRVHSPPTITETSSSKLLQITQFSTNSTRVTFTCYLFWETCWRNAKWMSRTIQNLVRRDADKKMYVEETSRQIQKQKISASTSWVPKMSSILNSQGSNGSLSTHKNQNSSSRLMQEI